jgi:hypothetical protein
VNRRGPTMVAALALAALAIPFTAGLVSAHSGSVIVSQTCQTWSAEVDLANNVTSDRTVVVTTTIPGTTGIAGNHYDTSYGQIWDASGPAISSGTVTLTIYNGTNVEFTASGTLPTPSDCPTPTAVPTDPVAPTPFESFQGETATPPVSASQTPFESFQGETATPEPNTTPPPTGTNSDGSSGSTPLFALLICALFGGIGLTAVQRQRRSIRR